jgi:hypothetical protein
MQRFKNYNKEIYEVEKMIDKLSLVFSAGLIKKENFATKKVE